MDDPIRILQVVFQMDRAGLETMLMNYYRSLDRNQIQFDFLMCHEGDFDYDSEISSLGGRIYHVPPISARGLGAYLRGLNDFFAAHSEYRIVHCHLDALSGFTLYAAKKAGIPIRIAHSHNNGFERDRKYPVRMAAKQLIPLFATDLWACSDEALRFMFGRGRRFSQATAIIPNAIEAGAFSFCEEERLRVRARLGIGDKCAIGHVGRFSRQKNHDLLIEIFAAFHRLHENSVLLLVGTGNGLERIRDKTRSLGLNEHVMFLGVQENVGEIYSAMDVFVLPSLFEGFGMALLEAQANGLSCLASDTVSPSVDVSGAIEWLSLKDSPLKWAQAIRRADRSVNQRKRATHKAGLGRYEIQSAARELQEQYLALYHARAKG